MTAFDLCYVWMSVIFIGWFFAESVVRAADRLGGVPLRAIGATIWIYVLVERIVDHG